MSTVYNTSFGEVIDKLMDGQIAEAEDSGYIVKRNGHFYFGTDVNAKLVLAPRYMEMKWWITPFFEERICACGHCDAPLKPMTAAYASGKLAERYHGEYYDHKKHGKPIIGLIR